MKKKKEYTFINTKNKNVKVSIDAYTYQEAVSLLYDIVVNLRDFE